MEFTCAKTADLPFSEIPGRLEGAQRHWETREHGELQQVWGLHVNNLPSDHAKCGHALGCPVIDYDEPSEDMGWLLWSCRRWHY